MVQCYCGQLSERNAILTVEGKEMNELDYLQEHERHREHVGKKLVCLQTHTLIPILNRG